MRSSCQGTWYGAPASGVAISSPFALNVGISGVFTTAAINPNGNLDLIYWQVQPNGTIHPVSEVQGDFASSCRWPLSTMHRTGTRNS